MPSCPRRTARGTVLKRPRSGSCMAWCRRTWPPLWRATRRRRTSSSSRRSNSMETTMIFYRRDVCLLLLVVALGLSVPAFAQQTRPQLPKGVTEKIVDVDGVKINYKIAGRGPVVVLLHGYAQTSHMWLPLMPLLAKSHTVIAPDLRGAGGSQRTPGGYDKRTLAKDIRNLVRRLGHEQAKVVGHDIGLMVAYAY